jgi:hypothetical protein
LKERWLPVGILAGGLFLVNIIARLAVRMVAGKDANKETWVGAVAFLAVGAVMIGAAYWWARLRPLPRVVGDLLIAAAVGCLLSALIGPLVSAGPAFAGGFGALVQRFIIYLTVSAFGALFGILAVMTAGQDYKSQALKRYAETIMARPRRVVRR